MGRDHSRVAWGVRSGDYTRRRTHHSLTHSLTLSLAHSWTRQVKSWEGITPESLEVFDLVTPRPEIVVLGLGDSVQRLPREVYQFFKDRNISVEIADTVGG